MGHVIVKEVTRPDYGMTPGERFPYEHEFAEPVHWQYVITDDPGAPPYRTPEAQAPDTEAHVQQHAQARVQAQGGAGRGQARGGGA